MEILVNGTPHFIADGTTAAQLLVILDLQGKRLAHGNQSRTGATQPI